MGQRLADQYGRFPQAPGTGTEGLHGNQQPGAVCQRAYGVGDGDSGDGTDRRGDHYPIYLCLYHPRDREKWLNAGVL